VLVWSSASRALFAICGAGLATIAYVLPLAIVVVASFAGRWNGVLPSHATFDNYAGVFHEASAYQIRASLATGLVASALALACGTWASIALRSFPLAARRALDVLFFVPSAVPSVSVGLALLVAFSRPPLLLNGTLAIVFVAHFVLVSAFAYGNVSAGLAALAPDYERVAESLGARASYRLRRVTLPLVLPQLVASFGLGFALSMGELGATAMIYPPNWVTMPVGIFALTDRGDALRAAAETVLLLTTTFVVLLVLARIPSRAVRR